MKKIFYLLIIICGFLFIQNVSAGDYYYYDTKQWVMDGTWSDHALKFDSDTNTYRTSVVQDIYSFRNGFKPNSRIEYDFDADYAIFNIYFTADVGSFYYGGMEASYLGNTTSDTFGGTIYFNPFSIFHQNISLSIMIKQDGPMLPCQFLGDIGGGILTVTCPLQKDVHYITTVIVNGTTNTQRLKNLQIGIGRYFSLEKSDNSSNEIIHNQNVNSQKEIDAANKNQQQTNNRLDNLNNSITSNSSDTSSESCGLLCKLKGIFTGIIELPSKLVNLLIDALKALFVPTDNQLYEIINDSKDLSENFGFVGESINFFITIFTSLLGLVNANGCIEFPEFTVGATSMFESITFWEKQLICLNDNVILSTHIETIRTVTSIVLVCLFINFAAAKFFSILSKNDSGTVTDIDSNGNMSGYEWSTTNGDRKVKRW